MKIYIVLTKSLTAFSKLISKVTSDEYTHASISLTSDLKSMYSYGRRIMILPYPSGFKREPIDRGFYKVYKNSKVAVYSLEVSENAIDIIEEHINNCYKHYFKCRYNFKGVALCDKGKIKSRKYIKFCSEFVAECLQLTGEVELPKEPINFHPVDFEKIEGIRLEYKGIIADFQSKKSRRKKQ